MIRAMKRLPVLLAVSFLVAAGCGDDDDDSSEEAATASSSPAQTCVDSWNAESNQAYQTALAGVVSAVGLNPEKLRVGTWPESERTVGYRSAEDAFGDKTGSATVPQDACLVLFPTSHQGEMGFFEDQGKWYFVVDDKGEKFPLAAKRSIADAESATADALGKLTLN